MLKEAGIDWTDLKGVTGDRKEWKRIVKGRMEKLDKWEKSRGHKWEGEVMEMRNEERGAVATNGFVCKECGKVCKSKGGLTTHRRRTHEESEKKKVFKWEVCEVEFKQEANLLNHKKVCGGAVGGDSGRSLCVCGKDFSKSYIARHRKTCRVAVARQEEEEEEQRRPRVYRKDAKVTCDCGRVMNKSNFSRHKREACPNGEAGP